MQNDAEEKLFQQSDCGVSAEIDGELVMLNMEQGRYYGMTGIAPHIFGILKQPTSLSEVVASVCSEYDVDVDTCQKDVRKFLEEMEAFGLIAQVQKD